MNQIIIIIIIIIIIVIIIITVLLMAVSLLRPLDTRPTDGLTDWLSVAVCLSPWLDS
jgi:uncharacterized protein YpmB